MFSTSLPALNGPATVLVFHNPHTNTQFVVKVLRTEYERIVRHYEATGSVTITVEHTPR